MEFEGRISKVLPTRTGTKQDGSEWKALPFVFEYYENPSDRYPDSVLLETMDHDIMRAIGQFVARGEDKKAIVKDGVCELTGEIKCRCGFSHRVATFNRKDGSGQGMMNNMRPYKLEITNTTNAAPQQPVQPPFPPQQSQQEENDDLLF
jgi:hypothetical protein